MGKLYSMTGFAAGSETYEETEISCEIRSLNSRYLEIGIKLPQLLKELEDPLKDLIRRYVQRGKVFCLLVFAEQTAMIKGIKVDEQAVHYYRELLEQVREFGEIEEPVRLEHLLQFNEIFAVQEAGELDETLKKTVFRLVEQTLKQLNENRYKEGQQLKKDIEGRLNRIEHLAREVARLGEDNARVEFEKLKNRLFALVEEHKVDPTRLELELALIAERVDVTEEVVRLKSHLQLFRDHLKKGSPVGKTLNFVLQEMHREANTIASKNTMVEISHHVVEMKEEIEKIREQVQNIE